MNAPDARDGFAGGGGSLEQATFCKTQGPNDGAAGAGDPKRPDEVILSDESALELCDTDSTKPVAELTNALPEAWYARIQFDELIDPSIEDLIPDVDAMGTPTGTFSGTLKNTQPVTLKCESVAGQGMVDVPYDGYYSPAGSSISYPLGPSLVIIPTDPTVVATASECTITLKSSITDKDGNQVPADQIGPYKFAVGGIEVLVIDPTTDDSKQDPIAAGVDITFNTDVTKASVKDGLPVPPATVGTSTVFAFSPALPNPYAQEEAPEEYFFGADFPVSGGPYTFTFLQGAKLVDQCGKSQTLGAPSADAMTQTSLTTNALKLKAITGAIEPGNKIKIAFNQYMDPASLDPVAGFSITPALAAPADVEIAADGNLLVNGNFALNTMYTFTLKNGTTIDDCPGAEFGACVKSTTYSSPMDQVVTFMTPPAILLKSISPKDNASESVATANANGILLTFNDDIDDTTFTAASYTITPAAVLTATNLGGLGGTYEQVELDPATPFAAGTYTLTIKGAGSGIKDKLGNDYSGTDQVIHFTVTPDDTSTHTCL